MTPGDRFVDALPRKTRFYDRNERRSYELTRAVASRLIDDPTLIAVGLQYAQRFMRDSPSQFRYFTLWEDLLRRQVREIVTSLLEDTPRGALLRDTQPVFIALPDEVRRKIIAGDRSESVLASA